MLALPRPIEQVELLPSTGPADGTEGGGAHRRRPRRRPPAGIAAAHQRRRLPHRRWRAGAAGRRADLADRRSGRLLSSPATTCRPRCAGFSSPGPARWRRGAQWTSSWWSARSATPPTRWWRRSARRSAATWCAEVNRALHALEGQGAPLGVEVTRADVDVLLPPLAKPGFDAVLEAAQRAEERLASARTDATRTLQAADREHEAILATAQAAAAERVGEARAQMAAITALEAGRTRRRGRGCSTRSGASVSPPCCTRPAA